MTTSNEAECVLTKDVLGRVPRMGISREDFDDIARAKELVVESLGVEERLNLVLMNYVEYESALFRGGVESVVFRTGSWSEFTDNIYDVNRRVLNLLSACRTYADQLRHFASSIYGKESQAFRDICEYLSEEYDQRLGYRSMEALRNFAQHRGMAVHHLTEQHWWVDDAERPTSRSALVPSLVPQKLADQGGFKRSVLEELLNLGDRVDLRPLLKEYIGGIGAVHGKVRQRLQDDVEGAIGILEAAISRYEGEVGDTVGLAAVRYDDEGERVERVAVFKGPVERRRELHRRNRIPRNLRQHFVTNEPKDWMQA